MPRKGSIMRAAAVQPSSTISGTNSLAFGGCEVTIPASLAYEQRGCSISIKIPKKGCIVITSATAPAGTGLKRLPIEWAKISKLAGQDNQGPKGLSVQLLNPKLLDIEGQRLLKAVLKLYSMELPEMRFAANTGKHSPFLEKCVTSGKYCTLLLKQCTSSDDEVLGAISYQILSPDTQYAEIPLAAVCREYQYKGIGSFLFKELQKRLQDVGVLTIFCWGDQESERFWTNQGFLKVADVDGQGKPRKLPIKPDIRRAMSIPGSAMLLVSQLYSKPALDVTCGGKVVATPPKQLEFHVTKDKSNENASPVVGPSPVAAITTPTMCEQRTSFQHGSVGKTSGVVPMNMDGAFSSVATQGEIQMLPNPDISPPVTPLEPVLSFTFAPPFSLPHMTGVQPALDMTNQEDEKLKIQTALERNKENIKPTQKASIRKRGRPNATDKPTKALNSSKRREKQDSQPLTFQSNRVLVEHPDDNVIPVHLPTKPQVAGLADRDLEQDMESVPTICQQLKRPTIMFMNMADENRRVQLTKLVERLGGRVSNDGNECTHVVTGETRRTLNFCNALNAGAWVVSPAWLKSSVKERRFVEEMAYILKDHAFEMKYKVTLETVLRRRKQRLHGVLQGMCIYPTKHVQPPLETVSAIVLSAGGKVLSSLEEAKGCPGAIVVACEDDIEEALAAAKAGMPTYSSEWLMSCIVKQELDMTTPQFAESL